mmetsp:Transcript_24403/g.21589  ORF Transcript_24403/g.21589 Transcript_24403/m.21589 type:complete len:191 (-) Transcript_24403:863-1435(-)
MDESVDSEEEREAEELRKREEREQKRRQEQKKKRQIDEDDDDLSNLDEEEKAEDGIDGLSESPTKKNKVDADGNVIIDENKEGEEEKKENGEVLIPEEEEQDESEKHLKIKKTALRIWGLSNEKIKRCWINYTHTVDTLPALYFSALFFTEFVNRYVEKKTQHYFSIYKDGQEWTAARRQAKKEQHMAQQ